MTTASDCASCGSGDPAAPVPEHGVVLCARCRQRLRLRLVDLTRYRRQRPAGPVPSFIGPQTPADVIPFHSQPRRQGATQ
jgi:hypothetical protein